MMMLVVILLQVLDGLKDNSTIKQLDIRLTGVAKKVVKIWQQILVRSSDSEPIQIHILSKNQSERESCQF